VVRRRPTVPEDLLGAAARPGHRRISTALLTCGLIDLTQRKRTSGQRIASGATRRSLHKLLEASADDSPCFAAE
jgi:hypothetical protein